MTFSACLDEDSSPIDRKFYEFEEGIALSGVKKDYNLQDILFLEVSISDKTLLDSKSNEDIFVSNAVFPVLIEAIDMDKEADDTEKFALLVQNGTVIEDADFETEGIASMTFGCPESDYNFRTGVQFLETGNYLVYVNRETEFSQIVFNESSNCDIHLLSTPPTDATVASIRFTYNSTDVNADLFEQYLTENEIETTAVAEHVTALEEKRAFFVKVD